MSFFCLHRNLISSVVSIILVCNELFIPFSKKLFTPVQTFTHIPKRFQHWNKSSNFWYFGDFSPLVTMSWSPFWSEFLLHWTIMTVVWVVIAFCSFGFSSFSLGMYRGWGWRYLRFSTVLAIEHEIPKKLFVLYSVLEAHNSVNMKVNEPELVVL